ncbi:MAG: hypothetical protein IJP91_06340, partial [Synergistaceae bacterium]|nr:hypothetical protein [Synergistaceae bacterium]
VYVRQDVFDAKMEAMFNRLHLETVELKTELKSEISELKGDIRALSERVDKNLAEFKAIANEVKGDILALNTRLDGVEKTFDARINSLDNNITWWIGGATLFLTAIALIPLSLKFFEKFWDKWWESREDKRQAVVPSFTLDDVKRLIAEAKLGGVPQV